MVPNDSETPSGEAVTTKQSKAKPIKVLPADRVGFDKQLAILRGYAAASGVEKKSVSNADVGSVVGIHPGSVSNCNPFFADVGLLIRDGGVYKPADAVFEYANSYEWDADQAATKLSSIINSAWFSTILGPRLVFRSLTKDEVIKVFAEEAKASPEYRGQLSLLLDYLEVAGIVTVDGNSVSKRSGSGKAGGQDTPPSPPPAAPPPPPPDASTSLHPFVQGLLKTLPKPESDWPVSKRVKWLQAASNIFDLIYTTNEAETSIKIISNSEGGTS